MNKFKDALVDRHIGAVLVGMILSHGVTGLVAALAYQLPRLIMRTPSSMFEFSASELVVGFAQAVATIAIGLLLLKWLYLPKGEPGEGETEAETS